MDSRPRDIYFPLCTVMSDLPASLPSWRIDAAALHAALAGPARGWAVELVDETGSTNADLVQACRTAAWTEAAMVRLTYRQTAGRGRLGRPWQGQAGLTFSAALPLPVPAPRLAGLSLAVGLAVAEALDDCAVGVHVGGPAPPIRAPPRPGRETRCRQRPLPPLPPLPRRARAFASNGPTTCSSTGASWPAS
ncbi:hypothetical protein [Cupriavidus sp. H19C3]|uniref:hypothetical protein n=1 Tax=Cupriavidus sp. H19C3 TaxID=3241603 RepID=UPI003BF7985D